MTGAMAVRLPSHSDMGRRGDVLEHLHSFFQRVLSARRVES